MFEDYDFPHMSKDFLKPTEDTFSAHILTNHQHVVALTALLAEKGVINEEEFKQCLKVTGAYMRELMAKADGVEDTEEYEKSFQDFLDIVDYLQEWRERRS